MTKFARRHAVSGSARPGLWVVATGICALLLAPGAPPARASAPARIAPASGIISTIAGGVGGPGAARTVAVLPCAASFTAGSVYVGDGFALRKVDPRTGQLATVAGNRSVAPVVNGVPASKAALAGACGAVADRHGNLLVGDAAKVQVVAAQTGEFYGEAMTAGDIYVIAGRPNGDRSSGPIGDGGPATKANLFSAVDVQFGHAGNLVIADSGAPQTCGDCSPVGALVRVLAVRAGTFYGRKMTAGDIYTVAGVQNLAPTGNGGPATRAWLGTTIGAVRVDHAGNLVVADGGENDLSAVIAPSVRVVAVTTGTFYGQAMTAGHIYRVAGNGRFGSHGNGGPATRAALRSAAGLAVDGAGNLVIADGGTVRAVAARSGRFYGKRMTAGNIYRIAGTGHPGFSGDGHRATRAQIDATGVALDAAGNLVVASAGTNRVRVVAVRLGTLYGQRLRAGYLYTIAGNGRLFSGDGGPPTRAEFGPPGGVAVNTAGDLAFADDGNNMVWLVAKSSATLFGRHMSAGSIYAIAGNGRQGDRGDRGPTTRAELSLTEGSVTFDRSGNVVVADAENNRVRVVAVRRGTFYGRAMRAGYIYTIAGTGTPGFSGDGGRAVKAKLFFPTGVASDHAGNVLVVDALNRRIRAVAATTGTFYGQKMTAGHIYTIAGSGQSGYSGTGGPATKAGMAPQSIALDASGNLLLPDASCRLAAVAASTGTFYGQKMTADHIYTIAGSGHCGLSGIGGPATAAALGIGHAVTVDRSGDVAVADGYNNVVWVIAARARTVYGRAMAPAHVYVVAGGGTSGLGDGGLATKAELVIPDGVAVSPDGNLLIADFENNRLRAVSN